MRILLGFYLLLSLTGATYYVDPQTGNNANAGTEPTAPWRNPPGTRNAAGTGFSSPTWGAISTANKVGCGDTILLKGGSTQTSAEGGAWCLAKAIGGCATTGTYYPTTCSLASPINIRVATSNEWTASTGHFTFDVSGIAAAASSAYNIDGSILVSGIPGIKLGGASTNQRLRIVNETSSGSNVSGVAVQSGVNGVTVTMDFVLQYFEIANSKIGLSMGETRNALASDGVISGSKNHAVMLGNFGHHECINCGLVNLEIFNNGTAAQAFSCDAIYIQGSEYARLLNLYVHDNMCNGYNNGAGDHTYPTLSRVIIRDSVFSRNGLAAPSSGGSIAGSNTEGGGDSFPSEVGAPSRGYCSGGPNDGAVCLVANGVCPNSACAGYCCSVYDAYSVFQRTVLFGAYSQGAYAHHGSGFTWWNRLTVYNNNFSGGFAGQLKTDRVAADHAIFNSIVVNRAGQTLLNYNTNSIHKVCRQNCPNAGIPCTVNADCGTCASVTTPACGQYLPMMAAKNNLFRPSLPSGADTENLTNIHFKCDASCTGGTAGIDCASDANCAGCAGGCNWDNAGSSFALRSTKASFLNDPSNKIGAAFDPQFVSLNATNCTNGTDVTACDFHLQADSPAIDAGTFLMRTNCASSPCTGTTIAVKENVISRGVNFNGVGNDPNTFFIPPNGYPGYPGDVVQIQGATCNPVGNPRIVSMTPTTIVIDRSCTWNNNVGVDLPWNGTAPDIGAFEYLSGTTPQTPSAPGNLRVVP